MICLDEGKRSCGCNVMNWNCGCKLEPFVVTRQELQRMNKYDLFILYTRCLNDEMSPIMWRGFRKLEIIEMFLEPGKSSVELEPFI